MSRVMTVRVLAVDDDSTQLDLLVRSLGPYGFDVSTTQSALRVAEKVRTEAPDMVLIDVNIPALRGDRILGVARQFAPPATQFILYSASDESQLRKLALEVGADGYLSKSVQGAELALKLGALYRRRRMSVA